MATGPSPIDNLMDVTQPKPTDLVPPLISIGEACRLLNRSRPAVTRLAENGVIYGQQVEGSKAWVFPRAYIERIAPILGERKRPGVHVD